MILGTAAYMSPEQAKGKPVDQRSDVYSFGLVLHEMVTGTRLHQGETTTEVLASVLKEEPRWDKVPAQLHRLLRRCLEKDPQKRQRHIGDVMALVDDAPAPSLPAAALPARRERKWLWAASAVAVLAAVGAAVAVWAPWRQQTATQAIRFEIQPTGKMTFVNGSFPMVSPNGKWVVLPGAGEDGVTRMYLRALDSVEMRPLTGTESGNTLPPPVFWSPDSRFIAFSATRGPFASGQLKKIDIAGGPPTTICDVPAAVAGGTWNRDGVIVFPANNAPGLMRVPAAGGVATLVTAVDRSRSENNHRAPQFLPDGKHFLYMRVGNPANRGVYVGSIDVKPEEQSLKPVLLSDRQAIYTASLIGGPGRLLFLRDTTLFSQLFDLASFELTGEPVPVADQVGSFAPAQAGLFSVSETGVLAYRVGVGGNQTQLTWFDSKGTNLGTVGEKGAFQNPAVSPDGARVAVTQLDRQSANSDVWVLDVARGTSSKVTFKPGRNDFPTWSPDGKSLVFSSNSAGHLDLYLKNADGSGEERLILKSDQDKRATSWSKDGRFLLYQSADPKTLNDIWVLPDPAGATGNARSVSYLRTEISETAAQFSPDGRWVAYVASETGNTDVFVRPFYPDRIPESAAGGKWLLSKGGAGNPRWRKDGKELYYADTTLQLFAVDVRADKTLDPGVPRRLFALPLLNPFDVTSDGTRFLIPTPEGANAPSPFTVVTNWQAALAK